MNPHSLDYVRLMLFYFVTIGFRSSNNRPIYARRLPGSCSAIPLKWARTLVIGKAPFVLCSQIDLGPTQWATNWGKVDISDQDDNIARSSAQSLIDPLLTPTKMQYIHTHTHTNYAILNCKTNCCEANNKKLTKIIIIYTRFCQPTCITISILAEGLLCIYHYCSLPWAHIGNYKTTPIRRIKQEKEQPRNLS